jgi:uncharacterized protein (TIGR04255 family)
MERTTALGRWPKAPLAYLIAEVRFQRTNDFDEQLPRLLERVADEYPIEDRTTFEATMAQPGTQPAFEPLIDVRNFAATIGLRLGRGSVAVHCTDYAGWNGAFQDQLSRVMGAVNDTLRPRVLLRTSIRTVDLLVPEDLEPPDASLVPQLRAWDPNDAPTIGEFEQANQATRFKRGNVATTLLVLSAIKAPIVLPPTLSAMPLSLSPIQAQALEFHRQTGRAFAMVDTDVVREEARPFDLAELKNQFDDLHRASSAVFLAATTETAHSRWQAK